MSAPRPLDLVRRALPDLPPKLRAAARFVLGHDFDVATRSMRDLAASAGSSPATFTRLAQALGYTGWDALRDAMIEQRRPTAEGPYSRRVQTGAAGSLPGAMLAADAAGLARLDPGPIAAAADALGRAPRIWSAGFRSCRSVAQLLHYQLRLFRPDEVRLVGGSGPEDLDHGAFRRGDAMVVIGFHPYSRSSMLAARIAQAAGCVVIAVADTPTAPMAEGADHLLLFDASGPGFFPSLTGAIATVQALVAASFALGGDAALERLRDSEARLAAQSQYIPDVDPAP